MYRYGIYYSKVPPWIAAPALVLAIVGAYIVLRGGEAIRVWRIDHAVKRAIEKSRRARAAERERPPKQ